MNSEIAGLRKLADSLSLSVEASEDVGCLAGPVNVNGFVVPNSLAVHPMEGCDGDANGRPSDLTIRRYDRFAAGGAGLLWAEAIAIVPEGRANPRQLWLHEGTKGDFAALVTRMRRIAAEANGPDHNPMIVAQLTHSGRYSKPEGKPAPIIPQHDPWRDERMNLADDWPVVEDGYLDDLQAAYVNAARFAFEVGFDAVDLKSCHGYLMNELFAGHGRPGKYGGPFENRTRLLREVVAAIKSELGADKTVVARLGVYDAIPFPFGWGVDKDDCTKPDLSEPKRLIGEMRDWGFPMVNITVANPYYNPHYGRPFNAPVQGGGESPEHPLVGVCRMIDLVADIQRTYPGMAFVGTGYSWLGPWMPYVAAASKNSGRAKLIGSGRLAFAYPDFARDIVNKGKLDPEKACIACSGCTQIMRDGGRAGCVVRDEEVYGPIYRHGRMSNRENLLRLAESCRQCKQPSCRRGCPAAIDIPRFIKLFREGDNRGAYEVIRESNIFPEICAWLCPVEHQCEGHCLMKSVGDASMPIAAIQRHLAEEANREGWSHVRLPGQTTGKRVAVIGAGPAGLACAASLLEAGHAVTVFDRRRELGGMVESVIPPDRQASSLRNEIEAIFSDLPDERLHVESGAELTPDNDLDAILSRGFDAAFIGIGLPRSTTSTDVGDLTGRWTALEFLRDAKKDPAAAALAGKRVAVIGGGNTAMDAAVTASTIGASDVYVIYRRSFKEMPAWDAERDRALNAGVHFLILTQQLDYVSGDGRLTGLKVCPTRLGEPDASGRRRPIPVPDSAYVLEMDAVIEAIGQQAIENLDALLPGVEVADGLIKTGGESCRTTRENVFAGGDLTRGPSTVVAAVADGMRAAKEIDAFLRD